MRIAATAGILMRLRRGACAVGLCTSVVAIAACGESDYDKSEKALAEKSRMLDAPATSIEPPTSTGRAYMGAQPCRDALVEYNTMQRTLGHDAAIAHVTGVYNVKVAPRVLIAFSDASARVAQC